MICSFLPAIDPLAQYRGRHKYTHPDHAAGQEAPVSDRYQQEHLDALPGLQGQELQGTLDASGESTNNRASPVTRRKQVWGHLNPSTSSCSRSESPPRSASCEVKYVHPSQSWACSRTTQQRKGQEQGQRRMTILSKFVWIGG